jgi:NAD(P)-dependent dehydrogenase (short-subunit alcohol dehydrogenase family)
MMKPECIARLAAAEHRLSSRPVRKLVKLSVSSLADVTKKAEVEQLFAKTQHVFGRLDILVNKAGIYENYPLEDITEERFHKQFDLNVLGLLLTSQQGVKHFGSTGGNIINISALASTVTINRELIRDLPWQISLWDRIPERVVHAKGSDT